MDDGPRRALEAHFDLEALDADASSIVHLSRDGEMLWKNRGWDRFAEANGAADLDARHGIGSNYFEAIDGPFRDKLKEAADTCARTEKPLELNYECSSAEMYRLHRMRMVPLKADGFLVTHSLVVEEPHEDRIPMPPDESVYTTARGVIVACSNCRRVRVQDHEEWHWVPTWVTKPPPNVSHGMCRVCEGCFYHSFYP